MSVFEIRQSRAVAVKEPERHGHPEAMPEPEAPKSWMEEIFV